MDSNIEERFSTPVVSPSNPVRDDLALIGPMLLATGSLDPFHSLHYFQYIKSSPHEEGDSFEIARHENAITRWWAYQKLHPTDDNDGDESDSEASWDNLSHSLENIAGQVSPAPSVKDFSHLSHSCNLNLKSCLKGSILTLLTDSTVSLPTPSDSPAAKRSGRRVMFNEVVLESMIADTPIIVAGAQQALGATTDTNDGTGFEDDWVHITAPSMLGLELGPEKSNNPLPSLIAGASGNARLTVKAIIPLEPVALYPPPQAGEIGVTIKFVPPTGMASLTAEELLPSDRSLRAATDVELAEAIDRLYARHDQGFMVGAVSAGGYGDGAREGGCLFNESSWMMKEGRRGRGREPKVLLGDEVKASVPAAGGQAEPMGLQDSVCGQVSTATEMTLLKGRGNAKAGTGKGKAGSGDVGKEGLVEHKASRGMLARMIGTTKGWIWRSG